ncbi:DUF998 domain-containing protein [Tessaracoccus lubricantis]|uniref:DUF998 domain-containing protein n=1 Tax=Tessaracoccus lubricantis TaxID=545543 RepID=A0ABP9F5T6_9ACTN
MREDQPSSHQQLGRTFITQQRVIALLSFFLPASLIGWSLLSGQGLRGSISEYYYTPMRDVFVGTLCALALFLWSYRGYHPTNPELRADRIVAKVASIAAALVALAPLKPRQAEWECTVLQCVLGTDTAYWVHNVAAAVFLVALATFCLVLFPMSAIPGQDLGRRLVAYGVSGATIVISVLLMVLWTFLPVEIYFMLGRYKPILVLETVALTAFAASWFLRSRAVEYTALARYQPVTDVAAPAVPSEPTPAGRS